jgi:hypothetical protein
MRHDRRPFPCASLISHSAMHIPNDMPVIHAAADLEPADSHSLLRGVIYPSLSQNLSSLTFEMPFVSSDYRDHPTPYAPESASRRPVGPKRDIGL